jgi:homospermidine synthase
VWAVNHPWGGLLEPDDLPHEAILDIVRPYLGTLAAVRTDWTPLQGRALGFGGAAARAPPGARADPWQFHHVRAA